MEFQGVLKYQVEFPRVLVVGLKFLRDVTQFCGVSKSEALFCLEFTRVK